MRSHIIGLLAFAGFWVAGSAFAEVLELEGTVKAVDATARTMSVERTTPKGTKTLELEVNKKAGDLSSVKVGDRISFSYDPDLELVTKLGGGMNESVAPWQGEWIAIDGYAEGQRLNRDDLARLNRRIIVDGNTLTSERTKAGLVDGAKGKITVDESGGVFSFDGVKVSDSRPVGWRGRFRLEKDLLTLAYKDAHLLNGESPPDFAVDSAPDDKRFNQFTFKRIATKQESGSPALGGSVKKLSRFTVSISDTGEVSVRLSQPTDADADGSKASGVVRKKQDDGSWTQSFRFDKPQAMTAFTFARNVSVDDGLLVMKPGKSDKGDYLSSGIAPKGRLRVPLRVDVDVESMQGNALLRMELNGGGVAYNANQLFFLYSNDGLSKEAVVEASTGQGEKAEMRLKKEAVRLGEAWEKSFRLPIPNAKNNDVYGLLIGAFNQCEVKVRGITITGQPVPLFGMGLDNQGPTVFVKMIAPNSLAKKAGIQEGDVVVTINGEEPKSMADALERMASVGFEQPCEVVVSRGSEKKTFTMQAKWDE